LDALRKPLRDRALTADAGPGTDARAELRVIARLDQLHDRWWTECEEHRAGALSADAYAQQTAEIRGLVRRLGPASTALAESSSTAAWARAFAELREVLLPGEPGPRTSATVGLIRRGTRAPVAPGERLVSGDELRFAATLDAPAYLYVFMRSPGGDIKGLFPHRRISVPNPVPAGELLVPSRGSFRVDDQKGPVEITVVTSTEALPQLVQQLERGLEARPDEIDCLARGRVPGSPGCQGDLGSVAPGPHLGSFTMTAEATGTPAVKVLTFQQG
jgi:hypothetical protein